MNAAGAAQKPREWPCVDGCPVAGAPATGHWGCEVVECHSAAAFVVQSVTGVVVGRCEEHRAVPIGSPRSSVGREAV